MFAMADSLAYSRSEAILTLFRIKLTDFPKFKNKIVILSAIDNLIKGGAGQAVQNLNYYFGYNVKKGLVWKI